MGDSREFTFFTELDKKSAQPIPDASKGRPQILLGAIPFGGSLDKASTARVINEFVNDYNGSLIDGAYLYGNEETTSTEIPEIAAALTRCKISTKVAPMFADKNPDPPFAPCPYPNKIFLGLTPKSIRKQVDISLNKLKRDSVDVLYLH